jgi:hypothetical protein
MTTLREINKMLFVCFGFVLNCYLVVLCYRFGKFLFCYSFDLD